MTKWRMFIEDAGPHPGEIDNSNLVERIQSERDKRREPKYDDELDLHDQTDFYIMSVQLFQFFYDFFGCA